MASSVSVEQSRLLKKAVEDFIVQAEAHSAYLVDGEGNVLACVSPYGDLSVQTIAALSAGAFSATRELAALLGEPSFHSVFHHGDNTNLYIHNVTADFLILVVFGPSTTAGLVKLYVERLGHEIDLTLRQIAAQTPSMVGGRQSFEMDASAPVFAAREKGR
jgi:predicted regulator of Ras-like GTPase activity (Roadblock/LC7/MglB family)